MVREHVTGPYSSSHRHGAVMTGACARRSRSSPPAPGLSQTTTRHQRFHACQLGYHPRHSIEEPDSCRSTSLGTGERRVWSRSRSHYYCQWGSSSMWLLLVVLLGTVSFPGVQAALASPSDRQHEIAAVGVEENHSRGEDHSHIQDPPHHMYTSADPEDPCKAGEESIM